MTKLSKIILVVIIVVIVAFLYVYPRLNSGQEGKIAAPSTERQAQEIPVAVVEVKEEVLDRNLRLTGTILANESVEISAEVAGIITEINFREGQAVKKGQVLARMRVDEEMANLDKLKLSKRLLEDSESRQRRLLEREAISQEEYDRVLTEFESSKADILILEAEIEKKTIRAPFSGYVGLREVSQGFYLTPGSVVTTLYDIQPVKIEFSVPGKYSNYVQKGAKITFRAEGQDQDFTGEVYATEKRLDLATRTLTVRALSSNREEKLFPGQFARIQLVLDRQNNAIMLPTEAVIPELDGHKVFVINEEDRAEERKVTIGIREDKRVQIVSGLSAGEKVARTGILQLKENSKVRVLED
ncbi:MAG: efflux RND transporter periplasmic adaptor subunit [Cyclobacteriaceae bacterium]|nr:efflux RND transporter periplasmic adaptor subunit [Cyclobacteriaceae bacterium]MCH8517357.1 efflux RND transporter periplasmic adaptor subunit [Cyclobacteriaceae bacterium]